MERMQQHEIARIIPPPTTEEEEALKADMALHGLRHKLVRYENAVLDGFTRYKNCLALGIEPVFRDFEGTHEEARAYVISMIKGRNLSKKQLMEIAKSEFRDNPSQTARAVALKVGLSPTTAGRARDAVAAEQNATPESGSSEPNGSTPSVTVQTQTPQRVEASGRRARGRQPDSSEVKAEKKKAKEQAAQQKKEFSPKQIVSDRDKWLETVAAGFRADCYQCGQDLVMILCDEAPALIKAWSHVKLAELYHKQGKAWGLVQ